MNRHENEILYRIMNLILNSNRDYISARYLSKALTELHFPVSEKNVLPYIGLLIDMGIIAPSNSPQKPIAICKTNSEILEIMKNFRQNLLPGR